MKYFCTYFDRNYLVKGLSLIHSLREVEKGDLVIYVVCMDELTRLILSKLSLPCVELIPMHEIEALDHDLLKTKSGRTPVEYLWTTTPTIILRVIERHPEIKLLTYVDADLYFYSSCDALYAELGESSVLIHEHRFPPAFKDQEQYGIFNVGLLCFRNNQRGLEVLNWWRERCIEWCYSKVEDGKFGDQGYLNDWPTRFPQVKVTQNIGVGVAPWNDDQYRFTDINGMPCVDGKEIVFYHFHSLTFLNPFVFIPARDPIYTPTEAIGRLCFLPYMRALQAGIERCTAILSDFSFGINQQNFQLSPGHALLAHRSLKQDLVNLGLPQKPIELDSDWMWFAP